MKKLGEKFCNKKIEKRERLQKNVTYNKSFGRYYKHIHTCDVR